MSSSTETYPTSPLPTGITRVRFGDKVVWGRKERNSGNGKFKEEDEKEPAQQDDAAEEGEVNFKIYDEWLIEEDAKKQNTKSPNSLEAVIAEYRNLRENYEYNLRYEEAGQFFIREMELRRKYKQELYPVREDGRALSKIIIKNIFERIFSFAALYYAVSKYGESVRRPLMITISVFSIATLYFWYLEKWSISDSISRTLTAFFPFFSLPENYGFLDAVLRATMIPMAGLLFITLRRKLERRFRH